MIGRACVAAVLLTCLTSGHAHAWIFPEHARITELALQQHLDARARRVLEVSVAAVQDDRAAAIPALCRTLVEPIAKPRKQHCTPFSALPALAADHAVDAQSLLNALASSKPDSLATIANDVSQRLADYLATAPQDQRALYYDALAAGGRDGEADDDQRRMFIRKLDLFLNYRDSGYLDRAEGARVHFQDSSASLERLLSQAAAGNLDNAFAQTLAHHLRSLQLARRSRDAAAGDKHKLVRSALLEHAFAVHFLEDAFAAGHIGTSHSVANSTDRLRRHDYLNRVGLPVTRSMAQYSCQPATEEAGSVATEHCWIAYGDGYLDAANADKAADAVARLAMQLALALDPALADGLTDHCREGSEERAPAQPFASVTGAIDALQQPEAVANHAPAARAVHELSGPEVSDEGQFIMHVYRVRAQAHTWLRVAVESADFPVYLNVIRDNKQQWRAQPRSVLDTNALLVLPVPDEAVFELRIGSTQPRQYGAYSLSLTSFAAVDEEPAPTSSCASLVRAYQLLDPRPIWTVPRDERLARDAWRADDERALAREVVAGADRALSRLANAPPLLVAHADVRSVGALGALPQSVVGSPFITCRHDPRWVGKKHPLCELSNRAYRFGWIDASLIRPVLAAWPGPTGSVRTIRGDDAFGYGLAVQTHYGGGLAVGLHREVPMAVAPFVSGGLAFRADRLIPGRLNREIVGLNLGLLPIIMIGMDGDERATHATRAPRYTLATFTELRLPLFVLLGVWLSGSPWNFGNVDVGPTGVRLYTTVPARLPGDHLQVFAWDIEALNIKIHGGTASRTASIGSGTDSELRLRIGAFRPDLLDRDFPSRRWQLMASVEFCTGYSLFLGGN